MKTFLKLPGTAAALLLLLPWLASGTTAQPLLSAPDCDLETEIHASGSLSELDGSAIRLANWNIQKASQQGWRHDLQLLGEGIDLLLLQEAVLERELAQAIRDGNVYSVFAPGYATGEEQTGVMTLSSATPLSECLLTHQEPWLQTPKATSASTYPLQGSAERLLVINVHAVNFTLGIEDLEQQLQAASVIISQHRGPVIFSGDFNTWSNTRMALLNTTVSQLGLEPLPYDNDQRKLVFGLPLDHVFLRGLRVISSGTRAVSSSDHNPIFATLALDS